jgi:hypothetical protein
MFSDGVRILNRAQLMEALESKACAIRGSMGDATPFNGRTVEDIAAELEAFGMERYGNEVMMNPRTGEQVPCAVFACPTYYQVGGCQTSLPHDSLWSVRGIDLRLAGTPLTTCVCLFCRARAPQRLKHMVEDKVHCLTGDHDVLTAAGWKPIAEVTLEDMVATLDPATGDLVYDRPKAVLAFPDFCGDIASVRSATVDLDVTMEHRMWARSVTSDRYRLVCVADLLDAATPAAYQKDAIGAWRLDDYEMIPEDGCKDGVRVTDMAAWLGMFVDWVILHHADGGGGGEDDEEEQVADDEEEQVADGLPPWVWRLGQEQCRALVRGVCRGTCEFRTRSESIAGDLSRLCLHGGWSADVERAHDGVMTVAVVEGFNRPVLDAKTHATVERYAGAVYCLQVASEVFYVRRNGKGVWTGNSRAANGPVVLLTRQPAEGRARDGGLRLGEMELECMWAHGSLFFLKERFMECSDNYRVFVCKECGMMAQVNPERGLYYCKACKNITNFAEVRVPYASKLLMQEIQTMCIGARFITS